MIIDGPSMPWVEDTACYLKITAREFWEVFHIGDLSFSVLSVSPATFPASRSTVFIEFIAYMSHSHKKVFCVLLPQ